jgi:hypothetical protein
MTRMPQESRRDATCFGKRAFDEAVVVSRESDQRFDSGVPV